MTHEPSARLAYIDADRECDAARTAWSYIYSRAGWEAEKTKRWLAFQVADTNKTQLFYCWMEARRLDIEEAERAAQAVLDSNLDIEMGLAKLEALS